MPPPSCCNWWRPFCSSAQLTMSKGRTAPVTNRSSDEAHKALSRTEEVFRKHLLHPNYKRKLCIVLIDTYPALRSYCKISKKQNLDERIHKKQKIVKHDY